jgi:hypothetical protein
VALGLVLLSVTVAGAALGGVTAAESQSSPIEVSDWTDLDDIRNDLDADYVLVNDLNETTPGYETVAGLNANGGEGFDPISGFSGSFDGQGNTIDELTRKQENPRFLSIEDQNGEIVAERPVTEFSGVDTDGELAGGDHFSGSTDISPLSSESTVQPIHEPTNTVTHNQSKLTTAVNDSLPINQDFEDGLGEWDINQRYRTSDEFVSRFGPPEKGSGEYSENYGGSVRLSVDGAPSTIGVARNVSGLEAGTEISVTYHMSLDSPPYGKVGVALYAPNSSNQFGTLCGRCNQDTFVAKEGNLEDGTNTISGTLKQDYPSNTEVRVLGDGWPIDFSIYVDNITVSPGSIEVSRRYPQRYRR